MEINKLQGIIESILFAAGESVSLSRLAELTDTDKHTLTEVMKIMAQNYDADDTRGITLIQLEDSYQLCTKNELYGYVQAMNEKRTRQTLSNAGLEVLSIVAYNQPVTRATLEFIRGVNSDGALNRLIEMGLVDEAGRLDAPGKPILYATTEEFLRVFSLSSLSELPEVETPAPEQEQSEDDEQDYTQENMGIL